MGIMQVFVVRFDSLNAGSILLPALKLISTCGKDWSAVNGVKRSKTGAADYHCTIILYRGD